MKDIIKNLFGSFHFANPAFFWFMIFIPLLVVWHRFLGKRGKRFIFYSSRRLIRDVGGGAKPFFARNLYIFKLAALFIFILALTRPQILNYYDQESKKGIDILITLDISGSMASIDFKPRNRLEVAKEVISSFIEKRVTDRLGLVIFAGTSYTRCPLTVDYDILKYFLGQTSIGELEDGTALGMALATSVNRIRYSGSRTKIIILLTDGVNNRGEIDPRDAAKIAKDYNVKVYTIGVGTRGKAPYPVRDSFGREQYMMVDVEIDEELLKEIANNTGGLYFRATDMDSLQRIFAEIDRWEKTEISTKRYYNARDLYIYFIIAALAIFLFAEFGKRTIFRSLP